MMFADAKFVAGLKAQHVSGIEFLSEATAAEVSGLALGSSTLIFRPKSPPIALEGQKFVIESATSAASSLLVLQCIFPFLLFASKDSSNFPIEIELRGGTNTPWSPSYEYLDQIFFPTLEDCFGIAVERRLSKRGWHVGPPGRGQIHLKFTPIILGQALRPINHWSQLEDEDFNVNEIDISILAPAVSHKSLRRYLSEQLADYFPFIPTTIKLCEDSGSPARQYVLLVAKSNRLRWPADILQEGSSRSISKHATVLLATKVCQKLRDEVLRGDSVDEHLQDQLVIFQALCRGRTRFTCYNKELQKIEEAKAACPGIKKCKELENESFSGLWNGSTTVEVINRLPKETMERPMQVPRQSTQRPFGQGSLHTQTARWVTSKMLPGLTWYDDGKECEGIGICFQEPGQIFSHIDSTENNF